MDYQGTLQREVWNGALLPHRDEIAVLFRKPRFLSLRWQAGLYEGTTLLERPGRNQGNLLLTLGGWFAYVTIRLPPIEVGEPFVPSLKDMSEWLTALLPLARRSASDRSLQHVEVRTEDPHLAEGRLVLSVPAFLIPFRDDAVAVYEFEIERGTGIPFALTLRGVGGEVRQRLTYTDLQVNVGVPVQAFDWEYGADEFQPLPQAETTVDLRGFVQNWRQRYGVIVDYTGVWTTAERRGARMVHRRARFKFRKPFDVYLEWTGNDRGPRAALFRQGWNGGRVRVRTTLAGLPLIGDLAPDAHLARWGYSYPITGFGLNRLVERLQEQLLQGWLQDELAARFQGVQEYDGRPCYVFEFVFPNSRWRVYPYYRVIIYWDIAQRVPVKSETFNWSNQLAERHEFHRLRLNVSLRDADFDAANPAYGFLLFQTMPRLDWFLTGRER
jgi:hypothetical protein